MNQDICTPTTMSHLLSLKSLTDLQLPIASNAVLVVLQPLASVLTQLGLHLKKPPSSNESSLSIDGNKDDGSNNSNNGTQMSYLLPFRSLNRLSVWTRPLASTYRVDITSPFIVRHWNKLDKQYIQLNATTKNLVPLIHSFLSLSLTSTLTSSRLNNNSIDDGSEKERAASRIRLWNLSFDEFNKLLEHMTDASLLIPSSVFSIPSRSTYVPTISLECRIGYGNGEVEALRIQSLERDMNNIIKSYDYTNLSSFTIHTYAKE
jgi:hypothetical protein